MPVGVPDPRQDRRRRRHRWATAAGGGWPVWAVLALVLSTGLVLTFNQQHSGDPLKVRREMRKF